MGLLGACARLARIVNSVMVGFAVLVGLSIVAGVAGWRPERETLLLAFLTGTLVSSSSMILNDIVDIEIDRINLIPRPLVTGELTLRTAWACFALSSLGGLVSAWLLGPAPFLVALLVWLLGVVYDLYGKRSGFPGNVMVALATSAPFPFAMSVAGCICSEVLVFWAIVFLTVLAREVAKDIADVEGDRAAGARTLPVILGPRAAARVAAAFYMLAVSMSPLPLLWARVNHLVYIPLVAVVDVILVAESLRILRRHDRSSIITHKRNVLIAMLIGLVAFIASSIM